MYTFAALVALPLLLGREGVDVEFILDLGGICRMCMNKSLKPLRPARSLGELWQEFQFHYLLIIEMTEGTVYPEAGFFELHGSYALPCCCLKMKNDLIHYLGKSYSCRRSGVKKHWPFGWRRKGFCRILIPYSFFKKKTLMW